MIANVIPNLESTFLTRTFTGIEIQTTNKILWISLYLTGRSYEIAQFAFDSQKILLIAHPQAISFHSLLRQKDTRFVFKTFKLNTANLQKNVSSSEHGALRILSYQNSNQINAVPWTS